MKKGWISLVLYVTAFIIISIFLFYPRDFHKIMGREIDISSNTYLTIINKESILGDGIFKESYNQNDSKKILDYLKSYKYRRTNINTSKLDNEELYAMVIKNNGAEVLRGAVRGEKYISLIDKSGRYVTYRVSGDKFDLEYLKSFFQSLK